MAAIGKKHIANKAAKKGLSAASNSRPALGGGGGSPAGGEGAILNATASRGADDNGVGVAAGTRGGGGPWGSRPSAKGTASDLISAEGGGDIVEATGARGGLASTQPGEGNFADRSAGGVSAGGVSATAAETAAEVGGKTVEEAPTSGDICFEDDDEDCTWCIPEVAAPKAVWQGHIGPVARIGSCGQPPCFFSLGEVCVCALGLCLAHTTEKVLFLFPDVTAGVFHA